MWVCRVCETQNEDDSNQCFICASARIVMPPSPPPSPPSATIFKDEKTSTSSSSSSDNKKKHPALKTVFGIIIAAAIFLFICCVSQYNNNPIDYIYVSTYSKPYVYWYRPQPLSWFGSETRSVFIRVTDDNATEVYSSHDSWSGHELLYLQSGKTYLVIVSLNGDSASYRFTMPAAASLSAVSIPVPTQRPTATPTPRPTATPTRRPTATPTPRPTANPYIGTIRVTSSGYCSVYSSASTSSSVIFYVHYGEKFLCASTSANFYSIILPSGNIGYIQSSRVYLDRNATNGITLSNLYSVAEITTTRKAISYSRPGIKTVRGDFTDYYYEAGNTFRCYGACTLNGTTYYLIWGITGKNGTVTELLWQRANDCRVDSGNPGNFTIPSSWYN